MAIASLVLGIISILQGLWTLGLMAPIGLTLGILSIIFGVNGKKDIDATKIATAGYICGIVGVVLNVLTGFYWFFLGFGLFHFWLF